MTRQSVERLLASQPSANGYLFRSRTHGRAHLSARQYARIVHRWIGNIGLDDRGFGTHSLRRTKVAQLYRKTGNLRAVQLLLGHAKIETTVRYLGVEVDDALRLTASAAPSVRIRISMGPKISLRIASPTISAAAFLASPVAASSSAILMPPGEPT